MEPRLTLTSDGGDQDESKKSTLLTGMYCTISTLIVCCYELKYSITHANPYPSHATSILTLPLPPLTLPSHHISSHHHTVCPYILGNEFCERLAFYGLSTNLVIYLTRVMGQEPGFAAVQVNLFEGTCYLTPLLGAWLADGLWGRYKTILVFSLIYLVGMLFLAATAFVPGLTPTSAEPEPTAMQSAVLYTSLYIVALGTGGIKPNVSAFGADQFDDADPRDRKEKRSFFNWFYFFVNIGSLLAVTVVVWVQENISWAIGFAIPAACMALSVLLFTAGRHKYTHIPPTESPISRVFKVVWAAYKVKYHLFFRKWNSGRSNNNNGNNAMERGGRGENEPLLLSPLSTTTTTTTNNNDANGAYSTTTTTMRGLRRPESLQWLDKAGDDSQFTAAQIDEVKLVLRMLPIFATTILYWTIYMQMGSFFVEQGSCMNRTTKIPSWLPSWVKGNGNGEFEIPAASLALVNTLAIVALIPVYDTVLVPFLKKIGRPMTLLKRIGWGLFVCILPMLAAALIERERLRLAHDNNRYDRYDCIVELSVWWQTPQYLLVGLSEVLTSIGQMEFFYDQAPDVMRSCSMALNLLSVALGSYLSGALVWATAKITSSLSSSSSASSSSSWWGTQGWLPKDLNEGRLDLFFLMLAFLMTLNMGWFLWVAVSYEYKKVVHMPTAVVPMAQRPSTHTTTTVGAGGTIRSPNLPPPYPRRGRTTAPMPSRLSMAHPQARRAAGGEEDGGGGGGGEGEDAEGTSPAPALYGRSVTFFPKIPNMPAPFR